MTDINPVAMLKSRKTRGFREEHHPLKVETRVRFPSGLLDSIRRVAEWQTREPQKLVPRWAWEFKSPLGDLLAGGPVLA